MRVLDLLKVDLGIDKMYWKLGVRELICLDSDAEMESYAQNNKIKHVFQSVSEIKEFIKELKVPDNLPFMSDRENEGQLWLRIPTDFVPMMVDQYGDTHYKYDGEGNKIPTDAVYLEIFGFRVNMALITLYTSGGNKLLDVWTDKVNGGINERLNMLRLKPRASEKESTKIVQQQRFIKKFFQTRRPSVEDMRFVHLMLNPLSSAYLSPRKAFKEAYRKYSSTFADLVLESDLIRNLIKKELSTMLDKLQHAIQNAIPPEKFAEFLVNMQEKSLEQGSTDDQLKVASVIARLGYTPVVANQSNVSDNLLPKDSKGKVDTGKMFALAESVEPTIEKPKIQMYGLPGPSQPRTMKELEEDYSVPTGYVFDDESEA